MGRNGNGVSEASETSYEITFTYKGVRCRERIKIKPSPANRKRVENFLGAINDAIEKGSFDYNVTFPDSPRRLKFLEYKGQGLSVSSYFDDWLTAKEKTLKASTWQGYEKIINNLVIPKFKDLQSLADLTRPQLKAWLVTFNVSNKRLSNIQSCIRSALQDAFMDELIESNPMAGWTYQRKEAPKKQDDIDPFTEDEQQAILAELSGQGRNLIQFAFWTGLRTSELIALNWSDIDWRPGIVRISRALTQASDEFEETKTRAGRRDVKLLAPAMAALKDQKQHTFLKNSEIFQNPRTNERWAGDEPIRKTLWQLALTKAKVLYRRPYQTRHTYASMMLSAGESPMWVAQQMGHSDWTQIARIYGRWIPDAAPQAGSKAVQIFGSDYLVKAVIGAGITKPS